MTPPGLPPAYAADATLLDGESSGSEDEDEAVDWVQCDLCKRLVRPAS